MNKQTQAEISDRKFGLGKKGQAETSLNWIFMVLAGGIILLFFAVVIYNMQSASTKNIQVTIVNRMNSIFSGTELGQKTSALIEDLPDLELLFECEGYSLEEFTGSYEARLTFAPSQLPIRPLILWTHDWNMPFFISNFLLVSSPQIRYVFLYDNTANSRALKNRIEPLLPTYINKEFVMITDSITYNRDFATRFVFLDTDPKNYVTDISFNNQKATAIKISHDNLLAFYQKPSQQTTFTDEQFNVYYDDATLLASIVTDNPEYYNCMLGKAFQRYRQIASIINQRVTQLKNSRYDCTNFYGTATETLTNQVTLFTKKLKDETLTPSELQGFIGILPSLISQLKQLNEETLPRKSCPLIY